MAVNWYDGLPTLTKCRRALWRAINAWPALKNNEADAVATRFKLRLTLDDEGPVSGKMAPTTPVDLPAICIYETKLNPEWYLNTAMKWPVVFEIPIWTQDMRLSVIESLVEDVGDALYQAKDAGHTASIVKLATGFHPEILGPFDFMPAKLGDNQVPCMMCKMHVVLRPNKYPFNLS